MKSVGYCHSEERSDVGIRSLRLVDENNGLPRRPIGPPRNDKALQSVPIQNLRKIPVFFKYRHNERPNMTALCNDTFYHGMGGFSRGHDVKYYDFKKLDIVLSILDIVLSIGVKLLMIAVWLATNVVIKSYFLSNDVLEGCAREVLSCC